MVADKYICLMMMLYLLLHVLNSAVPMARLQFHLTSDEKGGGEITTLLNNCVQLNPDDIPLWEQKLLMVTGKQLVNSLNNKRG